jgi:hypothetical protein
MGVFIAGCGGSSTTPASTTVAISGTVTATNGGQPLIGATVRASTATVQSNGTGGYSLTIPSGPTFGVALTVEGAGLVPHGMFISAATSHTVNVDAIQQTGFDLTFYRELVRNTLDSPASMQTLRRVTKNMSVFIENIGVDTATLDMVEAVVRDSLPRWTNGLTVVSVERGPISPHLGQVGWLNVQWPQGGLAADQRCGQSQIGTEGGIIAIYPIPGCACSGMLSSKTVVRHELGHALGFWHTDSKSDVMYPFVQGCDVPISARELAAAAIAYRRPVGNSDPDNDPQGAVGLTNVIIR